MGIEDELLGFYLITAVAMLASHIQKFPIGLFLCQATKQKKNKSATLFHKNAEAFLAKVASYCYAFDMLKWAREDKKNSESLCCNA